MWDWQEIIIKNIFIFFLAIILALLEIEIEGPDGWAKNLPTWRPNKDKWYTKLYASLFSNKELTGYHLTVFIFVLLIFHIPFVYGIPLTWDTWLRNMTLYMAFIILWDFLWFVINPAFTLKRFHKKEVTWHKEWFGFMPVDYYDNIIMSFVLVAILSLINHSFEPLLWGLANYSLFIIQLVIVIALSHKVFETQKWKLIAAKTTKSMGFKKSK